MSYFPMLIDTSKLNFLVVGGGKIAAEKLEKLVDFTDRITVISPEFSPLASSIIKQYNLLAHCRKYEPTDLKTFDVVIVATNIPTMHKEIYQQTRGSRTLVNSVDDTSACDFIFPSYIKDGDLTIAFSTGGASPAFAKHIKRYCNERLPKNIASFLTKMKNLRSTMPKGKRRMKHFEKLTKDFFDNKSQDS